LSLMRVDKIFNRVSKYGGPVGRVMVRESGLLNQQQLTRMLYSDYHEALGVALDTVYGRYLEDAKVPDDVESGLEQFIVDQYAFLDEACSGMGVAEFMRMKYDFHNLRVLAKKVFLGTADEDKLISELGVIAPELLKELLEGIKSPGIPAPIAAAVDLLIRLAEAGDIDSQAIDTLIDRAFLEGRLGIARQEGSRPLEAFCRSAIDVANLQILLRGFALGKEASYYERAIAEGGALPRNELVSLAGRPFTEVTDRLLGSRYGQLISEALERGEERARLTSLDKVADDFLLEKIGKFSNVAIGPERIVKYMMTRENEVVMLRIIFVGKLNLLPAGVIEARLPAQYLRASAG
jgi:V/A-type H+/Na+-transporting ATPase subunit C